MSRPIWRVTGIKRTRSHTLRLIADTADEAISIATDRQFRLSQVMDCVEEPPPQRTGKGQFLGLVPDNDPIYERGWTFVMGKYLTPRLLKPAEGDNE